MELIRGLHNIRKSHHGCVATIGNFDGVHLGHQALVRRLIEMSNSLKVPSLVMLFDPQPKEFFNLQTAPGRLQSLGEKIQVLAKLGVERILVVPFNQHFRSLTAKGFVEDVLIAKLGIKGLIIGDDFRFGCDRSGDFELLKSYSLSERFLLEDTATIELNSSKEMISRSKDTNSSESSAGLSADCNGINGNRVSSTRIREAVKDAQFKEANELLGRPFTITGKVAHGQKLGRQLGTPTANILLKRPKLPLQGVYVVSGQIPGKSNSVKGVANIGMRPTVNGIAPVLEVHFFDFGEEIYGQRISIEFIDKIRDEKKFNGLDELKQAIADDIQQAKKILNV